MKGGPRDLSLTDASELAGVRGVCLDIDDTLSTAGKLTPEAFAALWRLKRAGLTVVPITGRPAGWCDLIARFWPVDAVVGENGAFTFFMEDGVRRRIDTPAGASPDELMTRLETLGAEIRAAFPEARWASDQEYREYDLAIDIREDVPEWSRERVDELLALCHARGAHAKLSSIHVNAWFGDYDKRRGFEHWLGYASIRDGVGAGAGVGSGVRTSPPAWPKWDEWLYIGDSPNDEPMFAAFTHTVGVANLRQYLDRPKHPPRWITPSESGAGFAEMVDRLLSGRESV